MFGANRLKVPALGVGTVPRLERDAWVSGLMPTASNRMQLTLRATRRIPHVASRLEHVNSAWSLEPQPAPSRYCKDAKAYGHTTTSMRDTSTPRPHPIGCVLVFLGTSGGLRRHIDGLPWGGELPEAALKYFSSHCIWSKVGPGEVRGLAPLHHACNRYINA